MWAGLWKLSRKAMFSDLTVVLCSQNCQICERFQASRQLCSSSNFPITSQPALNNKCEVLNHFLPFSRIQLPKLFLSTKSNHLSAASFLLICRNLLKKMCSNADFHHSSTALPIVDGFYSFSTPVFWKGPPTTRPPPKIPLFQELALFPISSLKKKKHARAFFAYPIEPNKLFFPFFSRSVFVEVCKTLPQPQP